MKYHYHPTCPICRKFNPQPPEPEHMDECIPRKAPVRSVGNRNLDTQLAKVVGERDPMYYNPDAWWRYR